MLEGRLHSGEGLVLGDRVGAPGEAHEAEADVRDPLAGEGDEVDLVLGDAESMLGFVDEGRHCW